MTWTSNVMLQGCTLLVNWTLLWQFFHLDIFLAYIFYINQKHQNLISHLCVRRAHRQSSSPKANRQSSIWTHHNIYPSLHAATTHCPFERWRRLDDEREVLVDWFVVNWCHIQFDQWIFLSKRIRRFVCKFYYVNWPVNRKNYKPNL